MRLEPPSWWYGDPIPFTAWGLLPISALYGAIVQWRFHAASPYQSKLPVICVGNLTLGGAGKTPVALKLASLLREGGRKPAFLTRGYGGRERGPHMVDLASDGATRVGDEPLLLCKAAATVVSRDRPAGARLIETQGADTIVMDDGFQNPSLKKDFCLIVIDAEAGFGSGRVFPLGPLRAPLSFQAAKTDAILVLGEGRRDGKASGQVRQTLLGSSASCITEARIAPVITDEMLAHRFLAFCGIGRPAKFFDTLREASVTVVKTRSFPDHHRYTEADARTLIAEAKMLKTGLLTTEKDLVRLKGSAGVLADLQRSALALPITIAFSGNDEARLMKAIFARISSSGAST